jgi:hypothetical protein
VRGSRGRVQVPDVSAIPVHRVRDGVARAELVWAVSANIVGTSGCARRYNHLRGGRKKRCRASVCGGNGQQGARGDLPFTLVQGE